MLYHKCYKLLLLVLVLPRLTLADSSHALQNNPSVNVATDQLVSSSAFSDVDVLKDHLQIFKKLYKLKGDDQMINAIKEKVISSPKKYVIPAYTHLGELSEKGVLGFKSIGSGANTGSTNRNVLEAPNNDENDETIDQSTKNEPVKKVANNHLLQLKDVLPQDPNDEIAEAHEESVVKTNQISDQSNRNKVIPDTQLLISAPSYEQQSQSTASYRSPDKYNSPSQAIEALGTVDTPKSASAQNMVALNYDTYQSAKESPKLGSDKVSVKKLNYEPHMEKPRAANIASHEVLEPSTPSQMSVRIQNVYGKPKVSPINHSIVDPANSKKSNTIFSGSSTYEPYQQSSVLVDAKKQAEEPHGLIYDDILESSIDYAKNAPTSLKEQPQKLPLVSEQQESVKSNSLQYEELKTPSFPVKLSEPLRNLYSTIPELPTGVTDVVSNIKERKPNDGIFSKDKNEFYEKVNDIGSKFKINIGQQVSDTNSRIRNTYNDQAPDIKSKINDARHITHGIGDIINNANNKFLDTQQNVMDQISNVDRPKLSELVEKPIQVPHYPLEILKNLQQTNVENPFISQEPVSTKSEIYTSILPVTSTSYLLTQSKSTLKPVHLEYTPEHKNLATSPSPADEKISKDPKSSYLVLGSATDISSTDVDSDLADSIVSQSTLYDGQYVDDYYDMDDEDDFEELIDEIEENPSLIMHGPLSIPLDDEEFKIEDSDVNSSNNNFIDAFSTEPHKRTRRYKNNNGPYQGDDDESSDEEYSTGRMNKSNSNIDFFSIYDYENSANCQNEPILSIFAAVILIGIGTILF